MAIPEPEPPAGAPDWIVTFADMISLLVTFFILLMTFSSMEEYDAFQVPQRILGTTGTLMNMDGDDAVPPPKNDIMAAMDAKRGAELPHSRPSAELLDQVSDTGAKASDEHVEIDLKTVKDGIVISYDDRAAFAPGSTELSTYLKIAVGELARVLEHYAFTVVVEGHTDDNFRVSRRFDSAEALSTARASAVVDEMLASSGISPLQLQLSGYGASMPRQPNDTPEGRRANRRVEIKVMSLSLDRAAARKRSGSHGE
jgi:chemotaxis protein MotB